MHRSSAVVERLGENPPTLLASLPSLAARISSIALSDPARLAVVAPDGQTSYGELEARSNAVADRLRAAGLAAEECVALLFDRSPDFIIAALGVMKAGGAYLPLDASIPTERLSFILADSGAKLVLSHRGKATGATIKAEVIEIDRLAGSVDSFESDAEFLDPRRLAYVIYTSGSTGRPKGVEITHANLDNLIAWHQQAFEVTKDDRASHIAGLGFDAAGWEIWPHLTAGASLHLPDEATRRSPQALRDWLIEHRVTVSFVPTVLAEQLIHAPWPGQTPLRYLLTGADTLHRRPAAGLPFALINNYGPTECTVVATSGVVAAAEEGTPSIGKPIRNTQALILDDSLKPVPAGEVGELCLAGALVGRGYRNQPELTASKFVLVTDAECESLRAYRTGDRARLLPDGQIAFLGRVDDQVKIRGYRVELGEVVATLDRYPSIIASAAIVRDTAEGPALHAYIVTDAPVEPKHEDLRDYLAARLPDYMVPSQFARIAALPMTPNGKLDKAALPAITEQTQLKTATIQQATAASVDADTQQRVEKLVAALLNREQVPHDANFFMLGGHSMLGVQLAARLRDAFGVKLSLRQLFVSSTIASLSLEINRLLAKK